MTGVNPSLLNAYWLRGVSWDSYVKEPLLMRELIEYIDEVLLNEFILRMRIILSFHHHLSCHLIPLSWVVLTF